MNTRPILIILFALALAAVFASPIHAQEEEATPPPTEEEKPPEPEAIGAADVAARAVDAKVKLHDLREDLKANNIVQDISEQMEGRLESMDKLDTFLEGRRLEGLPLPRLEEVAREWKRHGEKLKEWSDALTERSTELTDRLERLDYQQIVWAMTRDSALANELPESSIEQIASIHSEIMELSEQITEIRKTLIDVQTTISDGRLHVRETSDAILEVIREKQQRILKIDSPPIWQATSNIDTLQLVRDVNDSGNRLRDELGTFMARYRDRIALNIFLILALVGVMLIMKTRSGEWDPDDEVLVEAKKIIGRPLSSALTLSLLFVNLIYPKAPLAIYELAAIIVLLPLAILVPRLLPPGFLRPAYGLFVLFLVNRLFVLAPEQGVVRRFTLLTVTVLGLCGAIWWLWKGRKNARLTRPWAQITSFVSWVAVILLASSLVANVIGAVGFGDLLTQGILASAFLGVLLFVGLVLLRSATVVLLRSRLLQSMQSVRKNTYLVRQRTISFLTFAAWVTWIWTSLDALRLYNPFKEEVIAAVTKDYVFGSLTISVGGVLTFFATVWIATLVSRFIRFILQDDILPRMPLARGVPPTVLILVNYSIMTVGFIIALAAAGIEFSQFAIIAGGLGVGIGFGMQTLVNNFISGLILMFERPVQVGDTVEIATLVGTVKRIGIRASTIRTFSGADVVVPNGDLLNGHVTNWTLSDMLRRIEINLGVAYGTDPKKVLDILIRVASENDDILTAPEPVALFKGFGESSLDFELRSWTAHNDRWMAIESEIMVAINQSLKDAEIEIPFPQRDLHVRSIAETTKQAFSGQSADLSPEQ